MQLLKRCRGEKADLICFPEYFPFHGEKELAKAARGLKSYVVAGLVEESRGVRYNTASQFNRQGKLVGRQRKCLLGALERRGYGVSPGAGWQVFPTDFGRLGLPLCFDFWGQPEAARALADQEADLVVNPGIFPILRGHWPTAVLVRAFDNFLPVVGVNTAAFVVEVAGRCYPVQGGRSFALQPPAPADTAELAQMVRNWDDLNHWFVAQARSEAEEVLTVHLDLAGPRHWRRVLWERFGITR